MNNDFYFILDQMFPNPICELNYEHDYELLIATMLSAQSTDKRVNLVTPNLFCYSLCELSLLPLSDIELIIRSVGTYTKKAYYVKEIARRIFSECDGCVPKNREYLESLPGVGRKTCNVIFSHIFNEPAIAVDTHVLRVSKILGLVDANSNVLYVEDQLMKKIPIHMWNRVSSQLVLFGRYVCRAKKPNCCDCLFSHNCIYKK